MATESIFPELVEERVPLLVGFHPEIKGMSQHGWKRWCERSGVPPAAKKAVAKNREWNTKFLRLERVIRRAQEVVLKPRYRAAALINNRFKPARYFRSEAFIFVVSVETGLVVTVHTGEARRWESVK